MTAFCLLKSVLYENRTEQQGSFFVRENDFSYFFNLCEEMFGSFGYEFGIMATLDFDGHWFYSYGSPVSIPKFQRDADAPFQVPADFTRTRKGRVNVYLYHID